MQTVTSQLCKGNATRMAMLLQALSASLPATAARINRALTLSASTLPASLCISGVLFAYKFMADHKLGDNSWKFRTRHRRRKIFPLLQNIRNIDYGLEASGKWCDDLPNIMLCNHSNDKPVNEINYRSLKVTSPRLILPTRTSHSIL